MINEKELRIGNLALNDKCVCTVENLLSDGICTLKTKQGNFIRARYELIEGIPLTDDILKNSGFKVEKVGSTEYWSRQNDKGETLDWLSLRRNEVSSFYILGRRMKDCFLQYTEKDVRIFYVHQLQNIYQPLTNEELNIKL